MPWSRGDVERHIKGLSAHQQEVWVNVANAVLERTGDEGLAVRQANAAAKRAPKEKVRESDYEEALDARLGESTF